MYNAILHGPCSDPIQDTDSGNIKRVRASACGITCVAADVATGRVRSACEDSTGFGVLTEAQLKLQLNKKEGGGVGFAGESPWYLVFGCVGQSLRSHQDALSVSRYMLDSFYRQLSDRARFSTMGTHST